MKRVLVRCDGARIPARLEQLKWEHREDISHRGEAADLNINILAPHAGFDALSARASDFLTIAAYAFAADQEVRRGGLTDVYGDDWRRAFTLCIPVNDPEFWQAKQRHEALVRALAFVSDDQWSFEFSRSRSQSQRQIPLGIDAGQVLGQPDVVCLFSGGLDSLCSLIEQHASGGRRPLLVSHSPAFHLANQQQNLRRELATRFKTWHFPYVTGAVHRRKSDARETTQRTRSFLYATLGVVVADRLDIGEVHLADNGVVSLNLPINTQLMGAQATRSTHPKFFRLYNALLSLVFPQGPRISNPLWHLTRTETLSILRKTRALQLIEETNSCSHQRFRTKMQPFCGVCSQCIDRRFAILAAGLEEFDPSDRFEIDIFTDTIPEGVARTMVYSYYRFAKTVADMTDVEVFTEYSELGQCIDATDPDQRTIAASLAALVRRHGETVVRVMEKQFDRHKKAIARQRLPDTCLIALVASQRRNAERNGDRSPHVASLKFSSDYSSVKLGDRDYALTEPPAIVVRTLNDAALKGLPDVPWNRLRQAVEAAGFSAARIGDVFKHVEGWQYLVVSRKRGMYRLNLPSP